VSETLVIRLPDEPAAPLRWVILGGLSVGDVVTGTAEELAAFAIDNKVVALAPAGQVLRISASVPLKGNAKIRQALPFALEEQLVGDIDTQHFAFSGKNADGLLPVAVVDRVLLQSWLDPLADSGIQLDALYAESDAVESAPATMSVLIDEGQAIVRDANGNVTATDTPSLPLILEMLLEQQAEQLENDATVVPVDLRITCDTATHEEYGDAWDKLRLRVDNLDVSILPDGALPLLAANITASPGINLLQGEYTPKRELPIEWENWRVAAGLLGAFVLLVFILQGLTYWQLNRADSALDAAAGEVLEATFPGVDPGDNPWNELSNRLGSSETAADDPASTSFVQAVEVLSAAFVQTPGIKMETLNYRSGVVDIQLLAPDVAALDNLSKLIAKDGRFSAEILSANPSDKVVKGRLQITGAEAS